MMRCWRVKDSWAAIIPARRLWLRHACSKLFVVGLSYDTNEIALRDAFAEHGEVVEVLLASQKDMALSNFLQKKRQPLHCKRWMVSFWMEDIFVYTTQTRDETCDSLTILLD
ncbi:glycine-rich RNA-binding protein 5, mitochondrial-like isoform X1 [Musa acuminata AAA Group]|uniref:(wild Malaysian banana) hypothetical protein n=1 Tax=Musa acuminata subsp. malaccensis TaxID=214687 RepID=A0A804I536_MUSAM|nr:PREDICTED: glycine-rich RNA-binding protein 5, mitochondrial isoform X1 [Musa acuminata subsp. malaccensis]CAG1862672.1 unnamed protein product [Musa acuminata subsp. malaccensis]